ncbi:MAG: hypothetical protein EXR36_00320 [Betaproteobacteria bacterium]|nr:hypothetical protein [Betaproteobacteria bacterium]
MISKRRQPPGVMRSLMALALQCSHAVGATALSFETVLERVRACQIDTALYRPFLAHPGAILINLPSSGALSGILVTQFYFAPGRNGKHDDYGVVFNAPLAHVASTLPEFAAQAIVNAHERELVPLARETGNPRDKSQTLLICRGGTAV